MNRASFIMQKKIALLDYGDTGFGLGVQREIDYPEYTLSLAPNDAIVLFSDGVSGMSSQ